MSEATFDVQIAARLKACHAEVCEQFPMVRSLASTIDYAGVLNDAPIMKGVWTGRDGKVKAADAIMGSLLVTVRMLEEQFDQALKLAGSLRELVQVMSAEAVRLGRQNEEAKADQRPTVGPEGPPVAGGDDAAPRPPQGA